MLSCWSTAFAGRQPPIDLDQLIVESGAIVEARVRVVDPHAGAAQPLTRVDYTVERALGFDYPTAGHFTLPEGFEADGTVHAHYAGPPGFVPGETYLLFLRRAPWRISPVTHWQDGALRLLTLSGRAIYVDATGRCVSDLRDQFGVAMLDRNRAAHLCPGELISVGWAAANRGTAAARFDVWWFASQTASFDRPDDLLLAVDRGRRLAAETYASDGRRWLRMPRHMPPGVPHYVGFLLSPTDRPDSNHGNNLSYSALRLVRRPDGECR